MCFSVQPNVAMASDNKQQCGNVGLLQLAALAPHSNPPLLSQGRGHITTGVGIHAQVSAITFRDALTAFPGDPPCMAWLM